MSNKMKDLRKQLKAVVAEILPEFVRDGLFEQLQKENKERLDLIEKAVRDTLAQIDARAKDHQHFVVREMLARMNTGAPKVEVKGE